MQSAHEANQKAESSYAAEQVCDQKGEAAARRTGGAQFHVAASGSIVVKLAFRGRLEWCSRALVLLV